VLVLSVKKSVIYINYLRSNINKHKYYLNLNICFRDFSVIINKTVTAKTKLKLRDTTRYIEEYKATERRSQEQGS
jgi:hypothetical protein